MAVKPPLIEGVVGERSDGSVVVRERLAGDVKAVHAWVEQRGMGVNVASSREQGKERNRRK